VIINNSWPAGIIVILLKLGKMTENKDNFESLITPEKQCTIMSS
jgi:hypothetical protein